MSKADRDRQALLQRLAREQRRALSAAARDADRARTPRTAPTPRRDDSPPSRTSEQPSAQSAARLKSLTPLYKQRQQRRLTGLIVIIIVLALALTVVTGTLSASLALLGDAVDSASLYLNRANGGWPATKSNRWRTASSSWAMRMCSSTRPTAPKFLACSRPTRGPCWLWAAPTLWSTTARAVS